MNQSQDHETFPIRGLLEESRLEDLGRITDALQKAALICAEFTCETVRVEQKAGGEPVTTLDRAVNECLLGMLPQGDEGWFSEESADDLQRLGKRRVWVVDPLDGTKEFLAGLPEWCVSIALVEDGQAVAGGICNPTTGEMFTGSLENGIRCCSPGDENGSLAPRKKPLVLASRSEMGRGEWDWLKGFPFEVRPVGSVAYKLALVAAGRADATWTLNPKSEWDIAAGVAIVLSNGGSVKDLDGKPLAFNQREARRNGLVAFASGADTRLEKEFQNRLCRLRSSDIPSGEPQRFASERRGFY
jgi:myo-inositol-1(or 4)-monophosphatase